MPALKDFLDNLDFDKIYPKNLETKGYQVIKVEELIYDWHSCFDSKSDLLEIERYYAAIVPILPIVVESMGSAAELGAFINDPYIQSKLYIILEKQYYSGTNNKSFINYGLIKNFESKVSTDGIYVIPDEGDNQEKCLERLTSSIIEHHVSHKKCNFLDDYCQILLLADIISILVICDLKEIHENFLYALEKSSDGNEDSKTDKVKKQIEKMLFVLDKLGIIKCKTEGKKYYISIEKEAFFLDYRYKPNNLHTNVRKIRQGIYDNFYKNNTNQNKIEIINDLADAKEIKWLEQKQNLTIQEEKDILLESPLMYKTFFVNKKRSGKRKISQPTAKLKILQKALVRKLQDKLPTHLCAKAYKENENGILENAKAHSKNKYFLKLDFCDFFPSIKAKDFNKLLEEHNYSLPDRINFIKTAFYFDKRLNKQRTNYIYKKLRDKNFNKSNNEELLQLMTEEYSNEFELSIGAPSSPFISNVMLYNFDCTLNKWTQSKNMTYTRFADDITISSKDKIDYKEITNKIQNILLKLDYPKLELNEKKQKQLSLNNRVTITGLNITSENKISIGRKKKKEIRAMIYRYTNNKLSKDKLKILRGWLAYCNSVEKKFLNSMKEKYSPETIKKILKI